jgi:hypothetical protein
MDKLRRVLPLNLGRCSDCVESVPVLGYCITDCLREEHSVSHERVRESGYLRCASARSALRVCPLRVKPCAVVKASVTSWRSLSASRTSP